MSTFRGGVDPPTQRPQRTLAFGFCGDELVATADGALPALEQLSDALDAVFLGWLGDDACYTLAIDPAQELPDGYRPHPLRGLFAGMGEQRWALAGRAIQILAWQRDHAFCGRCATATVPVPGERARRCPNCGLTAYPRLAPAVIVLVTRGATALLARGRNPPRSFFSTLAGFVEPGETLEEAVEREVLEETAIAVRDIQYVASQPWPFPNSLMCGFTARYDHGELQLAEDELVEGGWYSPAQLPPLPSAPSIARRLIDDWLATAT
jgi:NAD+ diphosphatase